MGGKIIGSNMKIDFSKFRLYADIKREKELKVENAAEQIADAILQRGQGIAAYDLAQRVYHAAAETQFDEKDEAAITSLLERLPAIWAAALRDAIVE